MSVAAMVTVFGEVLELCNVRSGEVLAVLTEGAVRAEYAEAFLIAARERGAAAFQINLSPYKPVPNSRVKLTALSNNRGAMAALKTSDIIIDLMGMLWSAEQKELQDAGIRILLCRESLETIVRMFPGRELRRQVEEAAEVLRSARSMRVTSPAGTDVTYELGQYPVITQYGYTDEPGRWDHLPGGFLFTGGNDGGVNGVVVINTGDIILPFKRYVSSPIRCIIEGGVATRIEGDHTDALILRDYMARFNDPQAYAISHIGWGMDKKAAWEFLGTSPLAAASTGVDGRAFWGNVLFSTGPNSELGGKNDTGCHLDIPLRGCTLTLDGKTIVENGKVVAAGLAAASVPA